VPEPGKAQNRPMPRVAWLAGGALALLAVALSVIFAVMHTNGTSGPSPVSPGNIQPQSDVLIIDNCSNEGRFEPAAIILTCGDGTATANGLSWSQWDSTTAVAHGTVNQVSCVPDCANGQDVAYTATLTLSEPVKASSGKQYFTRITVYYPGKRPPGSATVVYKDCYDTPPAPFLPNCPADERGAN
jgi:hypothetical protein